MADSESAVRDSYHLQPFAKFLTKISINFLDRHFPRGCRRDYLTSLLGRHIHCPVLSQGPVTVYLLGKGGGGGVGASLRIFGDHMVFRGIKGGGIIVSANGA